MARLLPKTLAKTISYIAYHAPAEYGLFFFSDGTMPWKEFYWALQEDPALRFVRQSHIHELHHLQIELPFTVKDNLLHLRSQFPVPIYSIAHKIPPRLFYACTRKYYTFASRHGLRASGRSFLAACADRDLALRIGRRRDPYSFLVEILAQQAAGDDVVIRGAGHDLFLFEAVPMEHLRFPPVGEEELLGSRPKKKDRTPQKTLREELPGSFVVGVDHFREAVGEAAVRATARKGKKNKQGPQWKREARKVKDRWKRTV